MSVIQLPSSALRVGHRVPFALRDASGHLLVARGTLVDSEALLQQLIPRGVYVDESDSALFAKAMAGKLDSMVRGNALLGRIALAQPEMGAVAAPSRAPQTTRADAITAWNGLMLRASALLREAAAPDFEARIARLDHEALRLLDDDADASLLTLIHTAIGTVHQYSITHAWLVYAVCELAARQLSWPPGWRPSLRRAALTMNLSMTALQDQLAMQDIVPRADQRAAIDGHALASATCMRGLGVGDELWLHAVEHHHTARAGRLAQLPAMLQLARLIQRADIFAARMSPRKLRQAMAATAAAKAAYLDENQQADEAGAAIIKAVGIYPPGSCVRLASNEVGVVLRRGRRANEPIVASVISRAGTPLGEPVVRDTRVKPHEVTGGIAPHELKVRLGLSRLMQLA
jgi:HD-GYP domain-containing protein (c-di-GMP phosphodiesterase class II)